jgi:hypothetical protein
MMAVRQSVRSNSHFSVKVVHQVHAIIALTSVIYVRTISAVQLAIRWRPGIVLLLHVHLIALKLVLARPVIS